MAASDDLDARLALDVLGAAAWGAELDAERNAATASDGRISTDRSRAGVFVVSAREGWQLARLGYCALTSRL